MSIITPKSSESTGGSSLAFVKPLPQRDLDPGAAQGDSAEFDVPASPPSQGAPLELWRKLLPDPDQPEESPPSCAGVMLGHFRIEEQIGRGGMGAVFRAIDTRLDREVALKVLAGPQSADESAVNRFLNEARAAARLDHDNVARVFYVGEDQGLHFIAFEFIHGANVRQVIDARGLLSPLEAVNYGLQIAHALRHIADAGVVHRDVKPSNIIITPAGRAKLVDLGLARKHDPEASKDLTVDGTTLGTFDYISPEQAKDPRKVDIRSDIYSLGCTLYHMLTGEPPYPQGTMLQKLLDHQGKDVPVAADRNSNVPPELSAVVKKMMASSPAERYATANELIGDLSILAHAYGLRPVTTGSLVWEVPGRPNGWTLLRRYRAWLATAALLVLGVFVIDAVQSDRTSAGSGSPLIAQEGGKRDSGKPPTTEESPPPHQTSLEQMRPIGDPIANPSTLPGPIPQDSMPLEQQTMSGGPVTPTLAADPSTEDDELRLDEFSRPVLDNLPWGDFEKSLDPVESSIVSEGSEALESRAQSTENPAQPAEPTETSVGETNRPAEPFVVVTDDEELKGYASLEAACRDAPDGSSIELNFDGLSTEPQRPLQINGKRLKIRAASGMRPIVRLAKPAELPGAQIVRMIAVKRGSLELYNVNFVLEVDPNFVTDHWVLFSLAQADSVMMRGVSVTVDNTQRHSASIVELAEPPPSFDQMPEAMDRPTLRFEAEDCFFRGQADLFRNENVDPARIRLSNVATALDGSLIRFLGMETFDALSDMNNDHLVELELRHVTACLANEMLRFEFNPGKSIPRLAVNAGDSVIVLDQNEPLVTMTGDIDPFDAQEMLEWSGDHSFLQTQDPVWSISGYESKDVSLSEWNDLWKAGHLERPDEPPLLSWKRPGVYSEITAADLSLNQFGSEVNPARGGASDGNDAGVQWESPRLPTLTSFVDNDGFTVDGE